METIRISAPTAYMMLDSWVLANILQLATFDFCRRFLDRRNDPCGRMFDQMTLAARSIQANIAEGSSRCQTSTETEMKLLDVARASVTELSSDYMFLLMSRGETAWVDEHPEAQQIRRTLLARPAYGKNLVHDATAHIITERRKFDPWLTHSDISIAANAMLILCAREIAMLTRQIQGRFESFKEHGGFTENMTKARFDALREQDEEAPLCPKCGEKMVKRVIKRGGRQGTQFWGCVKYPACDGARNI